MGWREEQPFSLIYDQSGARTTAFSRQVRPGIAINSQCTMNAANSNRNLQRKRRYSSTLDLTFQISTFFGPKNVYMIAAEGVIKLGMDYRRNMDRHGRLTARPFSISPPRRQVEPFQTFVFTVTDLVLPGEHYRPLDALHHRRARRISTKRLLPGLTDPPLPPR